MHAKCTECTKHKFLLRQLTNDRLSFEAQSAEYQRHLARQYQDRCVYWQNRALSRLGSLGPDGVRTVTIVLDGLDHTKCRYPRSLAMTAKEYDTFNRPCLDLHGVIAHGHLCLVALSEPWVPKDANWCCDLLGHTLHLLAEQIDLRVTRVIVQSDNTCREVKNNGCLRALASWVGSGRLWAAEIHCLEKGHTHEDIDAFFAGVCQHIESHSEIHVPEDFKAVLAKYLETARQTEPMKVVELVGSTRDWQLVSVGAC